MKQIPWWSTGETDEASVIWLSELQLWWFNTGLGCQTLVAVILIWIQERPFLKKNNVSCPNLMDYVMNIPDVELRINWKCQNWNFGWKILEVWKVWVARKNDIIPKETSASHCKTPWAQKENSPIFHIYVL